MVKASIEVVKNVDGRVESGTVIVQGKKLKFNNVWDDDGLLRRIEFDGREVPTAAELYWFMNEKFIERIRYIDLIDELTLLKVLEEITNIVNIENIENVGTMTLLEKITQIDKIHPDPSGEQIVNRGFELGVMSPWVKSGTPAITTANPYAGVYCVDSIRLNDYIEQSFLPILESDIVIITIYGRATLGSVQSTVQCQVYYTDGTSASAGAANVSDTWTSLSFFHDMNPTKYVNKIRFTNTHWAGAELALDESSLVAVSGRGAVTVIDIVEEIVKMPPITATDLDIRDLTSASDSVEAKQATAANLNANVFAKHDNKTYKTAIFDAAASGNLVAAVAAKVIKLHALTIQAQGTVVVNLNNGNGGASLMEWSFQAREGAVVPMATAPAYWAKTGVNTILYVTLSAAVQVTITAIYSDDDAA